MKSSSFGGNKASDSATSYCSRKRDETRVKVTVETDITEDYFSVLNLE